MLRQAQHDKANTICYINIKNIGIMLFPKVKSVEICGICGKLYHIWVKPMAVTFIDKWAKAHSY
ncbi:hypothetical protein KCF3NO3_41680 [Chryseobacterium sp. KCF3-3]